MGALSLRSCARATSENNEGPSEQADVVFTAELANFSPVLKEVLGESGEEILGAKRYRDENRRASPRASNSGDFPVLL
jgi:hypothetical protein